MANQRRAGRRTDYTWQRFDVSTLAVTASSPTAQVAQLAIAASATVIRIRGELLAWLDPTISAGDLIAVACGLRVAPNGSGTTVVIDPVNDGSADWLWYEAFHLGGESTAQDTTIAAVRKVIDNKSMRRMKQGEEIQFVMNQLTEGTAQAVNVAIAALRWLAIRNPFTKGKRAREVSRTLAQSTCRHPHHRADPPRDVP